MNKVIFSPNGKTLGLKTTFGHVFMIDLETGQVLDELEEVRGKRIGFASEDRLIVSAYSDNTVRVIVMGRGHELSVVKRYRRKVDIYILLSTANKLLASISSQEICIWDIGKEEQLYEIKNTWRIVNPRCVVISPKGKMLAAGHKNRGAINLWDMKTGIHLRTLEMHRYEVTCMAFSPDESILATGARDKAVRLWNVESGEQLKLYRGHRGQRGWIERVIFSPNGKLLLTKSSDNFHLWSLESGKQLTNLNQNNVLFSPNGHFLASVSSKDHSISIRDIDTDCNIARVKCSAVAFTDCAFSPDGHKLAAVDALDRVHMLDLVSGGYRGGCHGV